jgi:hypothetical protein
MKKFYICKLLNDSRKRDFGLFWPQNSLKIFVKRFGSKEKSRTFALPFEKRVTTSSLKRLKTVQEASTEKYNLSRSVNSFREL